MSENRPTEGEWQTRPVLPTEIEGSTVRLLSESESDADKWFIRSVRRDDQGRRVHTYLAEVHRCGQMSDEELKANAHLMAAAKETKAQRDELLAALQDLVGELLDLNVFPEEDFRIVEARNAIRRALGGGDE